MLPSTIIATALLWSCNPRVTLPHVAVFSTVEQLVRSDTTRTGFFTTATLFDTAYDEILYQTTQGNVLVPNDGTQNFLLCRYDTATMQPIWIATGGGSGGDGGVNYYTVPPENAVYVVGYFEDTAYFPYRAGWSSCDTLMSYGMVDMFLAKYSYDNGELLWCTSGGSAYSDIIFTDALGARHQETMLLVDTVNVTLYANFFGPALFGDRSIDAPRSGAAIQISFDKETGAVRDVRLATALPEHL